MPEAVTEPSDLPAGPGSGYSGVNRGRMGRPSGKCLMNALNRVLFTAILMTGTSHSANAEWVNESRHNYPAEVQPCTKDEAGNKICLDMTGYITADFHNVILFSISAHLSEKTKNEINYNNGITFFIDDTKIPDEKIYFTVRSSSGEEYTNVYAEVKTDSHNNSRDTFCKYYNSGKSIQGGYMPVLRKILNSSQLIYSLSSTTGSIVKYSVDLNGVKPLLKKEYLLKLCPDAD